MLDINETYEFPQATISSTAIDIPPAETKQRQAISTPNTKFAAPAATPLVGQAPTEHHQQLADQTQLPGRKIIATQKVRARQPLPDSGQSYRDNHLAVAAVGEIVAVYRRYEDLRRARQRIELQAIATCRNYAGGDKVAGMKLYKAPPADLAIWLVPYDLAMQPLGDAISQQEKLLTKLGKALPVAGWADAVPGLSPRFLAAIIGECGIGPGEYRSVSALWKRMGMAVIGGQRQRRVTGDAALEHGYVARRRALMWNIGDQVAVRQGIRNPKDAEGKPTGAVAINRWGSLYLERKAYELARSTEDAPITPMHAHNRAKRYVEKRLLRELWQTWRAASIPKETSVSLLPAFDPETGEVFQ
ncbi:hypothetical protein J3454_14245 [Erythrobacter sp. NFXS35]|uniref:hypothetical protein n=1 Tax=Erythrobacter sp. NFXS35 TaxID=2818436 RepID=UPI0032E00A37